MPEAITRSALKEKINGELARIGSGARVEGILPLQMPDSSGCNWGVYTISEPDMSPRMTDRVHEAILRLKIEYPLVK